MNGTKPLISICIPTYSRLPYLQQAVASALQQDYPQIEICIAQDIKPDGADAAIQNWCTALAQREEKVRYILNERNLGLAGNWNQLVSMAGGDYLIIIGDDDLLLPNYVSAMVELIESANADVVFCNQQFIDAEGNFLEAQTTALNKLYKRDVLPGGVLDDAVAVVFNNTVPMSAALVKKDCYATHRFDDRLNTPEFELFLQLALEGKTFAYCDKQLAAYRIHPASATSGGLTTDRFLANIIAIDVPQQYQPVKKDFIASKIIPAINRSLRSGDKAMAKALLSSGYYPLNKKTLKYIQYAFFWLPTIFSKKLL